MVGRLKDPTPERFDALADGYDAWYRTPAGRLTDRLEQDAVFSLIGHRTGRAADLSCGTGRYALELARRGWQIVGVDHSLAMLRVARRKTVAERAALALVAGDAAALPLRSGSLDLVTLILGLEFMEDPGAAFDEARRVLRARGLFVVAILTAGGAWTLWRRLKRRLAPSLWRHARFFSEAELERLLGARGFICRTRRRAVCYVPLVRSPGLLAAWERLGRRLTPRLCAFLVVQCEVAPSSSWSPRA